MASQKGSFTPGIASWVVRSPVDELAARLLRVTLPKDRSAVLMKSLLNKMNGSNLNNIRRRKEPILMMVMVMGEKLTTTTITTTSI